MKQAPLLLAIAVLSFEMIMGHIKRRHYQKVSDEGWRKLVIRGAELGWYKAIGGVSLQDTTNLVAEIFHRP